MDRFSKCKYRVHTHIHKHILTQGPSWPSGAECIAGCEEAPFVALRWWMEDVKYIPVCGHFLTHFKIPKLDLYSPSPLSSPPSHQKAFENKNIHYERKGLEDDEVGSFFYNFPSNFLPMFNPICNHSHHACDDLFVQSATILTL